jgi:hypothetical protein
MVKRIYKLGFLAAVGLGLVMSASGQGRGFSPGGRFPGSMPGNSRAGHITGSRRGFFPLTGTPLNPNFGPINGVPGLGFDFPHLAAVSRGFRHRFGAFGPRSGGFFTPLFFDALPLYYPNDYDVPDHYAEAEQQPQFVVIPPYPQPNLRAPAETAPRESVTPQVPAPPPPELGQLILVRSDGQVVLAVAFTVRNGQLTYITNEGAKRSFPVSQLDKEATRQMNDANGTSVSLPN